jgi:hypothetical protein
MRGKEVGGAEVFDMSPGRTRTLLSIDANFRVWTKWCPLEDTASFVVSYLINPRFVRTTVGRERAEAQSRDL